MDYSPSSRQYQVLFVDYGELKWVRETAVQHISEAHLELPCQAVRACLVGLELSKCDIADIMYSMYRLLGVLVYGACIVVGLMWWRVCTTCVNVGALCSSSVGKGRWSTA